MKRVIFIVENSSHSHIVEINFFHLFAVVYLRALYLADQAQKPIYSVSGILIVQT